ncbi:MAG: hypothetical protein JWO95_1580 [Verrucomicrobiales bacterium]|nr:hypothetical protein [Verrucomicrobiales bacterium]
MAKPPKYHGRLFGNCRQHVNRRVITGADWVRVRVELFPIFAPSSGGQDERSIIRQGRVLSHQTSFVPIVSSTTKYESNTGFAKGGVKVPTGVIGTMG